MMLCLTLVKMEKLTKKGPPIFIPDKLESVRHYLRYPVFKVETKARYILRNKEGKGRRPPEMTASYRLTSWLFGTHVST